MGGLLVLFPSVVSQQSWAGTVTEAARGLSASIQAQASSFSSIGC